MKIKDIIFNYCEGTEHLEFNKSDSDKMIEEIKAAVLNELEDAEHLDDAKRYIQDYL